MCSKLTKRSKLTVTNFVFLFLILTLTGKYLKMLIGTTHSQIKLKRLQKSMNMDIWVIGTLNQLFIRGFFTQIGFSKFFEM